MFPYLTEAMAKVEELKELEVNARKHADALNASCLKETHKQSVVNVYEHKRYNVGTYVAFPFRSHTSWKIS